MGLAFVLIVVAAIGVVLYLRWKDQQTWRTILENKSTQSEEVEATYTYLKENGIRCRMKTLASEAAQTANAIIQGGGGRVILQVHAEDLPNSNSLLEKFHFKPKYQ